MLFRDSNEQIFHIDIDETAKAHFLEMARWGKFLAILNFIVLGIIAICAFLTVVLMSVNNVSTNLFNGLPPILIIAIYITIIAAILYPTIALYRFSTQVKHGLLTSNKVQFNDAIKALKNRFKFMGILSICVLAIYGIAILVGIIAGISRIG